MRGTAVTKQGPVLVVVTSAACAGVTGKQFMLIDLETVKPGPVMFCDSSQFACTDAENLYEDIEPTAILDGRLSDASQREFHIQWPDAEEPSWVGCDPPAYICIRKCCCRVKMI